MENKNNVTKGIALGVVSAIAFGTLGTFTNILAGYKMSGDAMTVILPFVLAIYFGIVLFIKNKEAFKVPWPLLVGLAILGFVGVDGQNFCLIKSYSVLPFGLVSAIMFTVSFLVMIGSRIVFGNKITKIKVGAAFAATIGVVLVLDLIAALSGGGFNFEPSNLLWVAGGLLTVGGSYVAMKYFMEKGVDGLAVFFYMNLFAVLAWWATMFSPAKMVSEITNTIAVGGLMPLLGYVLITCILSFHLWCSAINTVDPTWVAIAYAFDPLTEIVFGFLIFAQKMDFVQMIGVIIIIAAVSFVSYLEGKESAT